MKHHHEDNGDTAQRIDQDTARTFVQAARHVIDALLIEAARVQQTQTPPERDYNDAALSREAPAGGWLSNDELRQSAQQMAEAGAFATCAELGKQCGSWPDGCDSETHCGGCDVGKVCDEQGKPKDSA